MDAKDKPAPKTEKKLDLSKVEIEPLFTDYVDFETFSKSDFRALNFIILDDSIPAGAKLY